MATKTPEKGARVAARSLHEQIRRRPTVLSPLAVAAVGIAAAVVLVLVAKPIFEVSGSDSFERKVAELLLQLALVVVLGALVKLLIDSYADRKARLDADNAKRADLLRRVRAEHVKVASAQQLLLAHNSGRTYSTQLQILMLAVPELEDIAEDIRAAPTLFGPDNSTIVDGIEAMVAYLKQGADEYVRCHRHVDADAQAGRSLDVTIREWDMDWVRDLGRAAPAFPARYAAAVDASKGLIRTHIYAN